MAVADALAQYLENAGAVNHARHLRRINERLKGWDIRTAGGLATTGTANGGVARYFGSATTGDLSVQQRGAGANMSVDVLLGMALVGGTESAHQGDYAVYNDATVNVVISAADAVNPRIDIIVVRVRDTEYSGGTDNATIEVVTGTPAGVPAEPTIPANCLSLARVDVAALAGSITNANITDRRRALSSLGGLTQCTSATRPSVNLRETMAIGETDTDRLAHYDGSAWIRTGWYSSTGRTGGVWRRVAAQSIPNSAVTAIQWDTEDSDSDGFLTPTASTLTVPAGLGGLYAISASEAGLGNGYDIQITAGGKSYQGKITNFGGGGLGIVKSLAATDTISVSVFQNSGGPLNVTAAQLEVWRLGA